MRAAQLVADVPARALPLLLPGLVAGWMYIFVASIRELSARSSSTLPATRCCRSVIWELYQNGHLTELAALGVLMVVVRRARRCVAHRLRRDAGRSGAVSRRSASRTSRRRSRRAGASRRVVAVDDVSFDVRRRRALHAARPVGLREDDDAALRRRARAAGRRRDRGRRPHARLVPARIACRRTSAASAWSSSRTRSGRT